MANFYGFNNGANTQQYGMGNPGSFNNSSYPIQPQTGGGQFMPPPSQPVQQQPAYMTYGHVRPAGPGTTQSYQGNFSYGNNAPANPPQQTNYGKQQQQQQPYFQSATSGWASTSTGGMNVKPPPPQPQPAPQARPYTNNPSSNFGNVVAPQQVTISATSSQALQDVSTVAFVPGKASMPSDNSNKTGFNQPPPIRPPNVSNYEKALIDAANSIYSQQHKGGGGQQNMKNLPYWKQKRIEAQQNRDPNKPIIASEIKAYLYAWLGKERTRPEYNITAHGVSPYRQTYVCEIMAPGFTYVGKGTAGNKKDSQTRAAWDFCDFLVREGKMKESELPIRESKFQASNNKLPATYKKKADSEILSAVSKKKVISNKINFVGGSTLHLSEGNEAKPDIGPVAYPLVNPVPTPTTNPAQVKVEPIQQVVVDIKHDKAANSTEAVIVSNDGGESAALKNEPVGEDYVEQVWTDGRVIRYRCKLCECEFNDPSARELHIRGRRHRLSYKRKVDPSLEVDVKLNPKQKSLMMMKMKQEAKKEAAREHRRKQQQWKLEMQKQEQEENRLYEEEMYHHYQQEMLSFASAVEFHRRRNIPLPPHIRPPVQPPLHYYTPPNPPQIQPHKTMDDDHVINKHSQIYPNEDELSSVQTAVQTIESALKEISNTIHEQEMKVFTASSHSVKRPQPERLLKAVLRVGDVAKGLLLHGHLNAQLVLMCNQKPSKNLLHRVTDNMPQYLTSESKMTMKIVPEECGFYLTTTTSPLITVQVVLTATQMRPAEGALAKKGATKPDPPDILDRSKCCKALAALRHAKWFQAKADSLQSCVMVTRVMKDLCMRVPTWSPLPNWAVELLVQRVIASSPLPLSPSVALLRVFESLASGLLLPGGRGILDPCEREPSDAASNLTKQEREDITASAQHALRLLSFSKIHKVLGMEPLPPKSVLKRSQGCPPSHVQSKKLKTE